MDSREISGKAEVIYRRLCGEIVRRGHGERFWSIREIMRRCQVSQLVVDRAVARLRREGLLVNRPRCGLFVRREGVDPAGIAPELLLWMAGWDSCERRTLTRAARAWNQAGRCPRAEIAGYDYNYAIPPELEERIHRVSGIVVQPSGAELTARDICRLERALAICPVVVLNRHLENMGIPSVGLDDTFAGHLAMRHLDDFGHERVGVLISEPRNEVIMSRVRGAADYGKLHGIEVVPVDCGTLAGEEASANAYHRFGEALRGGLDFTALVGVSGESVGGAVNACHNYGVRIPDDLSVVAISSEVMTATLFPPIDTVADHIDKQLEAAFGFIMEPDSTAGKRNLYFQTEIIRRGSVAAPRRRMETIVSADGGKGD